LRKERGFCAGEVFRGNEFLEEWFWEDGKGGVYGMELEKVYKNDGEDVKIL